MGGDYPDGLVQEACSCVPVQGLGLCKVADQGLADTPQDKGGVLGRQSHVFLRHNLGKLSLF